MLTTTLSTGQYVIVPAGVITYTAETSIGFSKEFILTDMSWYHSKQGNNVASFFGFNTANARVVNKWRPDKGTHGVLKADNLGFASDYTALKAATDAGTVWESATVDTWAKKSMLSFRDDGRVFVGETPNVGGSFTFAPNYALLALVAVEDDTTFNINIADDALKLWRFDYQAKFNMPALEYQRTDFTSNSYIIEDSE